jgi:hypothetical protein
VEEAMEIGELATRGVDGVGEEERVVQMTGEQRDRQRRQIL